MQKLKYFPVLQKLKLVYFKRRLTSRSSAEEAVGKISQAWRLRIDDVISSPDNAEINRCEDAGKLDGYTITMHNGVKVCANGYYGEGILNMLIENKGVHEPQEERAFEEIIKLLPEKSTMLELGAYWGFYSLSLLKKHPKSTCYLVEPDLTNLFSGKVNFKLNGQKGHFTQALVGNVSRNNPKTISVDTYCKDNHVKHLNILHSDIQGAELKMLQGAESMLSGGNVDYVFISTHTNDLHRDCIKKLESYKYKVIAEVDMTETFSYDGLIVAKHQSVKNPNSIDISRKPVLKT